MKVIYKIGADTIWLVHFAVVLVVLFGWLIESLWFLYMAVLLGFLTSILTFGYCILSKWEYNLRKKIDPELVYDFTYTSYYTYQLTRGSLSNIFIVRTATIFVGLSLAINLYFRYLY